MQTLLLALTFFSLASCVQAVALDTNLDSPNDASSRILTNLFPGLFPGGILPGIIGGIGNGDICDQLEDVWDGIIVRVEDELRDAEKEVDNDCKNVKKDLSKVNTYKAIKSSFS